MYTTYRQRHTSIVGPLLIGCACIGAGYLLARSIHTNDGFVVKNGIIQYKQIQAPITVIDSDIIVGTLSQRIETILKEDPVSVENTVQSLIRYQTQRPE
jgi:hypothetical protein